MNEPNQAAGPETAPTETAPTSAAPVQDAGTKTVAPAAQPAADSPADPQTLAYMAREGLYDSLDAVRDVADFDSPMSLDDDGQVIDPSDAGQSTATDPNLRATEGPSEPQIKAIPDDLILEPGQAPEPEQPKSPAQPEPKAEEEPEPEPESGDKPPQYRFRPKNEREQEIFNALKRNPDWGLDEATNYVDRSSAKPEAEGQPESSLPEGVPHDLTALDAEAKSLIADRADAMKQIKAKQAELKQAIDDVAIDEQDSLHKEISELVDKVAAFDDRQQTLIEARSQVEAHQRQTQDSRDQQWQAAQAKAREHYPQLRDANSPLLQEMQAIEKAWNDLDDPRIYDVNLPIHLANTAAAKLGIAPGSTGESVKPAPAAPQQAQPQKQPVMTPAPGSAGTQPGTQRSGIQERIDKIQNLDDVRDLMADIQG